MPDSDSSGPLLEAIVRGIFIGASLGVIVGLFDIIPVGRGAALGGICGAFAGITHFKRRERQEEDRE